MFVFEMMPRDPSTLHLLCDDRQAGIRPKFVKKKTGLSCDNEIKGAPFPS
jgi:hypothetical protein